MPSRNRFLSSYGVWLLLAAVTACIDAQEEKKATVPPPITGTGTRTSGTQAQPSVSGSAARTSTAGTSATRTQTMSGLAADGGVTRGNGAEVDLDAGPAEAGSGRAGAGGRSGSAGTVAAGSGGRAGAGGMSGAGGQGGRAGQGERAGQGGRGGQGGAAGSAPSEACMNQLCFTLVDCWLLSVEDCGYVACDNFICR